MALQKRLGTDPALARYAGWFIPLKIETNGEQWQQWASRYRHEGRAIPIVYVVRADGEQLFGQSGALPGTQLPLMIESVLSRAGTIYNDQQLQQIERAVTTARQALTDNQIDAAVRELSSLNKLGSLGALGSFAESAKAADALTEELVKQGQSQLVAAQEKLEADDSLAAAMLLMKTRRVYITLPPIKDEIVAAINDFRSRPELKDVLKLAEQLDEVSNQLELPAGKRRALISLRRIISENPGTPAAELAAEWMREHFPDESVGPDSVGSTQPQAMPDSGKSYTWTSNDGFSIEASWVGYGYTESNREPYVVLQTTAAKQVKVPFARLSAESQTLAKQLVQSTRTEEDQRDE